MIRRRSAYLVNRPISPAAKHRRAAGLDERRSTGQRNQLARFVVTSARAAASPRPRCTTVARVAERSGLPADAIVVRFGLHWGSTLYVGNISTSARSEVTALGDEVNEAARIEACATGERALASKSLIERLDVDDAGALGLDPDRVNYTALAELATATDKARRDAPAIAVVDVAA